MNEPIAPPTSRRAGPSWQLFVGLACGGCLLMVLLLAVGGFFLFRSGFDAFKQSDPVAREFAHKVFAGDTDSAFAMISSQWRATTTRDQFREWSEYCRKQMGGQPTLTFGGYHFFTHTGGRRDTITYRLQHGAQSGTFQVVLVRESGKVRVQAANFSSGSGPVRPGTP